MATKKQLEQAIKDLSETTGIAITQAEASDTGKKFFIKVEHDRNHGGYHLKAGNAETGRNAFPLIGDHGNGLNVPKLIDKIYTFIRGYECYKQLNP